eukprot:662742_1
MCASHGHAQSPSQTFETYADTSSVSLDVNRFLHMVLAKKICIDQHEQKQNHINTPQKHTQSDTIEGHQSYRSIKTMCTSHGHAQSPSQTFETPALHIFGCYAWCDSVVIWHAFKIDYFRFKLHL